ncbi:conserved hypothetical protein [Ricinus communis]|uniref:Uncharacterized protein n=1 Tax=Ricinus communis TaxID=3988 RepID=B9T6P6_RICCO|nr:conserved hypothetical protein [Ricinus communis]
MQKKLYSFFGLKMDNYEGDLIDILREGGTSSGGALGQSVGHAAAISNWNFNQHGCYFKQY